MPGRAKPDRVRPPERERVPAADRAAAVPDVDEAGPVGPAAITAVQRSAGNRAAARLAQRAPIAAAVSVAPAAAVQRQEEHWAKATYPSARKSMEDHFRRHPSSEWSDVKAYTDKALEVLGDNYDYASKHKLADGSWGWKIRTSKYFGIYTNDDKIVTFGER